MKILIPKDFFYNGSPEQIVEVTSGSIDNGIKNARKIFGDDFMKGETFEEQGGKIIEDSDNA